jgi:hypothetical protein
LAGRAEISAARRALEALVIAAVLVPGWAIAAVLVPGWAIAVVLVPG